MRSQNSPETGLIRQSSGQMVAQTSVEKVIETAIISAVKRFQCKDQEKGYLLFLLYLN